MGRKTYYSELSALLSIRNFSKTMERHYAHMMELDRNLDELERNSYEVIEAHCTTESQKKWKIILNEIKDSLLVIKLILNSAREKVNKRDRSDSSDLWLQFESNLEKLKSEYVELENLGFDILNESDREGWKNKISNFEETIIPMVSSHAQACRIELKMVERFSPDELSKITKIIIDKIPEEFTLEEAERYEKDYLSALEDFKMEFSEEKNLWDRFLDVLAGGTHQSPSERVMLQRWIAGDKQEL